LALNTGMLVTSFFGINEETYTFEDLLSVLPEGWQEMAKELGALQWARKIKTPEDLLIRQFFFEVRKNHPYFPKFSLINVNRY
jgi:hypothetical protein